MYVLSRNHWRRFRTVVRNISRLEAEIKEKQVLKILKRSRLYLKEIESFKGRDIVSPEQADQIVVLKLHGWSGANISRLMGFAHSTISRILKKKGLR